MIMIVNILTNDRPTENNRLTQEANTVAVDCLKILQLTNKPLSSDIN